MAKERDVDPTRRPNSFKCPDCGRQSDGTERSPGAVSAICPDCQERRDAGKEPAHVRADAQKLRKRPSAAAAAAAAEPK